MAGELGKTYNHDIKGLVQRIDAVAIEINRSASGNVPAVNEKDMERWRSYSASLRGYTSWIRSSPSPLDLPETHPAMMEIPPAETFAPVNNYVCNDLVRLLMLGRGELASSASTNISSGLLPKDNERWLAVLDKYDSLLDLAESQLPLDLPESQPFFDSVKPGARGAASPADTIELP